MKCPDARLYYMASARVGDAMYFLSGDEGPPVPILPTVVSKYSALTDSWTSASKAPTWGAQRVVANSMYSYSGAGAVGTRIYYIGSFVPAPPAKYGISEAYETFTDSWTTVMAAPIAAAQGTAVAVNGNRLYAFSAKYPGQTTVFMYDAATDVWTSRAQPHSPSSRWAASHSLGESRIALIALRAAAGKAIPLGPQWASATTAGNVIFVAGGAPAATPPTPPATVHAYTTTTDTWTTGARRACARARYGVASCDSPRP
jgi:hypothetical protein